METTAMTEAEKHAAALRSTATYSAIDLPRLKNAADFIEQQAKRIEELEAGLKPFSDEAADYHMAFGDDRGVRSDGGVKASHLRRARAL